VTGVQRYARELVQALDAILDSERQYRVTVMSPRVSGPLPTWRNITLREIGRLQGHAWEQWELPWHARGRVLFCPGNTAPLASLLGSQSTVVTVHDLSYRYFPDAYSSLFRLCYGALVPLILRRANAIITVSRSERVRMLGLYPQIANRLHVVQNGGMPAACHDGQSTAGHRTRDAVLYVGSLSKRKNFPGLLNVAVRLARKRKFLFIIVGSVPQGISGTDLGIPDDVSGSIKFVGQIDDPVVLESYYRRAACFLFPSYYEASPLPPIEAMAFGCPVVTSDIPSLRERCGNAALYCNPDDIDSIVSAVERVMDDSSVRAQLSDAGLQQAAEFTWERCARETLRVISECIETQRELK
jgi:glycosyltransferase involved in cell wall biosynthesis